MEARMDAIAQVVPAIRHAQGGDTDEATDVINAALGVAEPRVSRADVSERIERGRFLIADAATGVIGTIFVDTAGDTGEIELLAVAPGATRRGVGGRLLDVAEALCRADGCTRSRVRVADASHRLLRYYRRAGYCPRDEAAAAGHEAPWKTVILEKALA